MRLRTLRLHGFKSFADRTTIDFRDGVTAVVGSNGCGKSNIADAIRWVLGEQRASAMRGAKMEEVIFQGTARRRPLNFAEVTLLFDNESGRVPVPQSEIEVSRKVFREGGSEYSLNRTACRLRDIQGLLRDTGLGSNAYAVIEIGMVETLLSDRAEERRTLFEEAAGIGRYKDSRQAATRRLEAAEIDITRLDDLIAEVEAKVRALSRQRRKAERHRELEKRRFDLDVGVARHELDEMDARLAGSSLELARLAETERAASAERSVAEAVVESRRIEAGELGRERVIRSGALDTIRSSLHAHEQEVLLSSERRSQAQVQLGRLAAEKAQLEVRLAELEAQVASQSETLSRITGRLVGAREQAEAATSHNREARQVLQAERVQTEEAARRTISLAREIAVCEGDRSSAERRGRDAIARHAELAAERERVLSALGQMTGQTELWEVQAVEIRIRLGSATSALKAIREEVSALRAREIRARDELRQADDRCSTLSTQVLARESMELSYEGFSPAVAAIMASRNSFPGVHSPLADHVRGRRSREKARSIEAYLGPLLQALVVEDMATVRAIRGWFREEWKGGGSLVLLPLDAIPTTAEPSSLPAETGANRWIDILLSPLETAEGDPLGEVSPGVARAGVFEVVDERGIVRLLEVGEAQGLLVRREALETLRAEARAAEHEREVRSREREALRTHLGDAERRLVEVEEAHRAEDHLRRSIELDAEAHRDRRARLLAERDQLEASLGETERVTAAAQADMAVLESRLNQLSLALEAAAANEASARSRLAEAEASSDQARDQEAEFRVALAKADSDVRDAGAQVTGAKTGLANSMARLQAIEFEGAVVNRALNGQEVTVDRSAKEIQRLYQERDAETVAIAMLDARLAEVDSELSQLGERAKTARRREAESAEGRHQLEMQVGSLHSRAERIRERLEVEWGKPWATLLGSAQTLEGSSEEWKVEARELAEQAASLGAVNMLAVEEHAEEERRLAFLSGQRNDLVVARENLIAAIRQINRTAREVFESTFEAVRTNFHRTFHSLFNGGECDIRLADTDDPLESPIEIQASPVGKRTQRIHLLSGGERTLTALALLFALYLVKPSPFCVLDEVDAPLDESNVGRFLQLLYDFKSETQFIVITHNSRTMEAADWVYGVTMEDPGVSSIVGVELVGAWSQEGSARAG